MKFERAGEREFPEIQKFYWDVIDGIHAEYPDNPKLGWGKGVYPTDAYLKEALSAGELYRLTEGSGLSACVILNNRANEGYAGCPWSLECAPQDILYVHTLAVHPSLQKKGIGKIVVREIINLARRQGKKRFVWTSFLPAGKRSVSTSPAVSVSSLLRICTTKTRGLRSIKCTN